MPDKYTFRLVLARIASVFIIIALFCRFFTEAATFEYFNIGTVLALSVISIITAGGLMLLPIVIFGSIVLIYTGAIRKSNITINPDSICIGIASIVANLMAWVAVLFLWKYAGVTFSNLGSLLGLAVALSTPYDLWQAYHRHKPAVTDEPD